jgi:uncharacterized protein (TIGR02757 family)
MLKTRPPSALQLRQQERLRSLGGFLNELQTQYHKRNLLDSDPLEFVYHYSNPWDQELVALVAALLAYGNVKQVRKSVSDVLARVARVAESPSAMVRGLEGLAGRRSPYAKQVSREFESFVHRFNRGPDLVVLFQLISETWIRSGSVGAHFLGRLEPEQDITDALSLLIADWRKWSKGMGNDSFQYLLTSPADGSSCKRWCMLLRWMGRKDELDPGLWNAGSGLEGTFPPGKFLNPRQLVLPLDTHTGRISQYLGLTKRKTLDWKAALEITQNLSVCDPEDPTRYDFSLSRLGILDVCQRKYRAEICINCQLLSFCKFAQKNVAKKSREKVTKPTKVRAK